MCTVSSVKQCAFTSLRHRNASWTLLKKSKKVDFFSGNFHLVENSLSPGNRPFFGGFPGDSEDLGTPKNPPRHDLIAPDLDIHDRKRKNKWWGGQPPSQEYSGAFSAPWGANCDLFGFSKVFRQVFRRYFVRYFVGQYSLGAPYSVWENKPP